MPPADGEATTAENPQLMRPSRPQQGDHFGRSPDLRVKAEPDLPIITSMTVVYADIARRLQLRGQLWSWHTPHHIPYYPTSNAARTKVTL
jgi:hypothetical protein